MHLGDRIQNIDVLCKERNQTESKDQYKKIATRKFDKLTTTKEFVNKVLHIYKKGGGERECCSRSIKGAASGKIASDTRSSARLKRI